MVNVSGDCHGSLVQITNSFNNNVVFPSLLIIPLDKQSFLWQAVFNQIDSITLFWNIMSSLNTIPKLCLDLAFLFAHNSQNHNNATHYEITCKLLPEHCQARLNRFPYRSLPDFRLELWDQDGTPLMFLLWPSPHVFQILNSVFPFIL